MNATEADQRETKCCDECVSTYFADSSKMMQLCNECAFQLYGYPQCEHEFDQQCCSKCGWDGSVSAYLRGLEAERGIGAEQ